MNKEKRKFVTAIIYYIYLCVGEKMTTPFLDTLPLVVLYCFFALVEIKKMIDELSESTW